MKVSPCMNCTRVADPRACENKKCQPWRNWFISRWESIRSCARQEMEQAPQKVGIMLDGQTYAAPHQVTKYLQEDPCKGCLCPKDLCRLPCRLKNNWNKAREEVLL